MWLLQFWQQYCAKGTGKKTVLSLSLPPLSKPITDWWEIPSCFFKMYRWWTTCHKWNLSPLGHTGVKVHTHPLGEKQSTWLHRLWEVQLQAPRQGCTIQSRNQSWAATSEATHEFCHPLRVCGILLLRGYGFPGLRPCYKTLSVSLIRSIVCCLQWSMHNPTSFIIFVISNMLSAKHKSHLRLFLALWQPSGYIQSALDNLTYWPSTGVLIWPGVKTLGITFHVKHWIGICCLYPISDVVIKQENKSDM